MTPYMGDLYADPDGTAYARGTQADPLELQAALNLLAPGRKLYLLGGTYTGNYTLSKSGAVGNLITVQSASGAAVEIDGALIISGDYIQWTGTRHTDSTFTDRDSTPTGGKTGIDILGNHIELKRCLVRNFAQGVSSSDSVSEVILRGNNIYYCGWDSNLGHGIYIQNVDPWKYFYQNIVHSNFGYNFHLYGAGGETSYMHLEGNATFNAGVLRSAGNGFVGNILVNSDIFSNIKLIRNYGWFSTEKVAGGSFLVQGTTATVLILQDNICGGGQDGPPTAAVSMRILGAVPTDISGNILYAEIDGWNLVTWPDNIQNDVAADKPDSVHLELIETGYATLTIYNMQAQADTIQVDLSSLDWTSGTVLAANAQDPLVDIQTLTITAGMITINMQAINRTVETPVGWPAPVTTFPSFGCMILELQ
jgi:hypothetical protein